MRKLGVLLIIGIFLLLFTFKPTVGIADTEIPEVIISELAWAGSSASSSDEWIELRNTTSSDIDIAGWQLTKNTGTETVMVTIPITDDPVLATMHIIPANSYFLVANWNPEATMLDIAPNYNGQSNLTLSNSKLEIKLYQGSFDSTDTSNLIDTAWNGTIPIVGVNGGAGDHPHYSMERNSSYGLGDKAENWHTATLAKNFKPDPNGYNLGTPKAENSVPPIVIPAPIISRIDPEPPNQIMAGSDWTIIDIVGNNFATEGTVQIKLAKTNPNLSIWATILTVINNTTINSVKFEIPDDTEAGEWDLVIINPDGQTATLPNALEIVEPEEDPIIPTYSDQIILSELYPHPNSGQEEFIELYNQGDNSVNLNGWKLDDQSPGGSAEYTIATDIILGPHQYLIFLKSQTHIYLNDTGDYARLIQPNGTIINTTSNYGTAATGYSYAKINSNWQWTRRVTPNQTNIYESTAEEDEADDEETDNSSPDKVTIKLESDSVTATAVMLLWQINWPGAIGDLKIYQSDKSGQLGDEVGRTNHPKTDYQVTNLLPKTKYFFTVVGTYNVDDIKSNQITFTTTTATGTTSSGVSGGITGTPKQIVISELLPNPNAGENEFIELYNPTDQAIDIAGWKLQDASGRVYVINALDLIELAIATEDDKPTAVILAPQQYLLLEYPLTHIRLNNSGGEEVQLLDGGDNLIDEVAYDGSAKPGHVYALSYSTWFWSEELTPGEPNDISFASDEDSGNYLVDSGFRLHWPILLWLSALFSAIMLAYGKRFYLYHR